MKNIALPKFGWTLAAAFLGVTLAVGFQSASDKVGTVDIAKVMDESDMGKASQASLSKMNQDRVNLLQFMSDSRVLTEDQAKKLHDLWLKGDKTPVEASDLEKLKSDITKDARRAVELTNKATLTNEERALLDDFARRSQVTETVGRRFQQEFYQDLEQATEAQQKRVLDQARVSVQSVAKDQGFSMVFESRVAPYAANDLTDATLTAMNAKK